MHRNGSWLLMEGGAGQQMKFPLFSLSFGPARYGVVLCKGAFAICVRVRDNFLTREKMCHGEGEGNCVSFSQWFFHISIALKNACLFISYYLLQAPDILLKSS